MFDSKNTGRPLGGVLLWLAQQKGLELFAL